MKIPFLKKGDTIAIATPSRKAGLSDFELFENYLAERGFKTVRAGNIFLSDNQFAGNDSSRIEAMNNLIEDKKKKEKMFTTIFFILSFALLNLALYFITIS